MDDGYLGSGLRLKRSVERYGQESHTREIISTFGNSREAYLHEAELVTNDTLRDPLILNLKPGGDGGWRTPPSEEQSRRGIKANRRMAELRSTDAVWRAKEVESKTKALIKSYNTGSRTPAGFPYPHSHMIKLATTPEARDKKLTSLKRIGHAQGEKNSQFGTCWVVKDGVTSKIKLDLLDTYLSRGYRRGRK